MKRLLAFSGAVMLALTLSAIPAAHSDGGAVLKLDKTQPGRVVTQKALGFKVDSRYAVAISEDAIYDKYSPTGDFEPVLDKNIYEAQLDLVSGNIVATMTADATVLQAKNRLESLRAAGIEASYVPLEKVEVELLISHFTKAQIEDSLLALSGWVEANNIASAWEYDAVSDSLRLETDLSALGGLALPKTEVPITVFDGKVQPAESDYTADLLGVTLPEGETLSVPQKDIYRLYTDAPTEAVYSVQYDLNRRRVVAMLPADSSLLKDGNNLASLKAAGLNVSTAPVDDTRMELRVSRFTTAQINETAKKVREFVESNNLASAFEYDVLNDSFSLTMDMARLASVRLPKTKVPLVVKPGEVSPAYTNEGTTAPFKGGATIYNTAGVRCTSGILPCGR